MKRLLNIMILSILIVCSIYTTSVKAEEMQPRWTNVRTSKIEVSATGNKATCILVILGVSGTSKISGTLTLSDTTSNKNVSSWSVSSSSNQCDVKKKATITSGHKLKLSFSGYVYDANGKGEYVSLSSTN